jgi:hypothetical protein
MTSSARLRIDADRNSFPGKIAQPTAIQTVNPLRSLLANRTMTLCSCRSQNHDDSLPLQNLQLIQNNFSRVGQQRPLSHNWLRGIVRAYYPFTAIRFPGKVPTRLHQI